MVDRLENGVNLFDRLDFFDLLDGFDLVDLIDFFERQDLFDFLDLLERKVVSIRAEQAVIGRSHGNTVRIPSAEVSRQHCRLSKQEGLLMIRDLGSVNGTMLNGQRIEDEEIVRPGDRIEIGPVTFVVEYELTPEALRHLRGLDGDVEVLEEPTTGLFGRVRGEARVRARVRPAGPRPKRTRRSGPKPEGRSQEGRRREPAPANRTNEEDRTSRDGGANGTQARRSQSRNGAKSNNQPREPRPDKEKKMGDGITLAEQAAIGKEFLEGILQAMSLTATVTFKEIDAETLELSVNADPPSELGVLVGPRGTTLQALQELTRTVVQAKSPVRTDRILVDVAHYRERRVAALGKFANQVAVEVLETGEERALEPMSAADRKAVHDALTENEGILTRSEGEEPRRFVVVAPS